jgi:hypothetical protein
MQGMVQRCVMEFHINGVLIFGAVTAYNAKRIPHLLNRKFQLKFLTEHPFIIAARLKTSFTFSKDTGRK